MKKCVMACFIILTAFVQIHAQDWQFYDVDTEGKTK